MIYHINSKKLFTSVYFILTITILNGQDIGLEKIKKAYPDQTAVFTQYNLDVDISVEGDQLVVTSHRAEEKLLMTDQTSLYAKDQIYSSSFEELSNIEAYTLVPHKNRFKKQKVEVFKETYDKNSSVFYNDTKVLNFIYPALTEGAKTFVSYSQTHSEPRFSPSYYFQTYLPIVEGQFTVTVDDEVNTDLILHNADDKNIEVKTEKLRDRTKYIYEVKHVKELKFESSSPNMKYYTPHVNLLIRSYDTKNGHYELLSSEESLYNWYKTFTDGLAKHDSKEVKNIVEELVKDVPNDLEKVKKIYYWVQQNIKYIAFEDGMRGLIPHNGEYVCSKRFGDCKDMASILINMMHMAGIKGYFTWVGTRDIPYDYSKIPSPIVDNHMIATYINGSDYYFLDATSQYSPFGLPSSMIQGKEVLIGKENGPEVKKVPIIKKEHNIMSDTMFISLENGIVKGKGTVTLTGYAKTFNSYRLDTKDSEGVKNYLSTLLAKGSNKFNLQQYTLKNLDNLDKPIIVNYEFEVPDYYKKIGNEIYINGNLDKSFADEIIDEDRELPLENEYKYYNKIVTRLKIPDGYKVSFLPENSESNTDIFGYSIKHYQENGNIIINKEYYLDYLILDNEKFDIWNNTIKKLSAALRESIILTKSDT